MKKKFFPTITIVFFSAVIVYGLYKIVTKEKQRTPTEKTIKEKRKKNQKTTTRPTTRKTKSKQKRQISGCTDKAALNYYKEATIDNKSCRYITLPRTKTQTYKSSSDIGVFRRQANSSINKRCREDRNHYIEKCNFTHPTVRNFAAQIAGKHPGEFNIAQVCDLFDYYYKNWKYVNDPQIRKNSKDYYAFASETIQNNLNGDCDDFAILMCSSILAIGGEARLNTACNKQITECHAWAEVNIGTADINEIQRYLSIRYNSPNLRLNYREKGYRDGENKWVNLDWFGNHPGGEYFDIGYGQTYYVNQEYCYDFSWY